MPMIERMVYARRWPVFGRIVNAVLRVYGLEISPEVQIGPGLLISHRGMATVVHPRTAIGANVRLYHNVTIGRKSAYRPGSVGKISIGDSVVLCPGSFVLCDEGTLEVGEGTVLGANSVLTESTGVWEVWAGNPARRVSTRPRT